jgi:hypothetical protein
MCTPTIFAVNVAVALRNQVQEMINLLPEF